MENIQKKYPEISVTADMVVMGFDGRMLHILLIERGCEPYKGMWALPGGFMHADETIEECARRELFEETGISDAYLRQFEVFSNVDRDPRGRVVTVAFIALVSENDYKVHAGDDAANAAWFEYNELPPLAFDHSEIIREAKSYLRDLIATRPVVLRFLDSKFSIAELQRLVEIIKGESFDRRNFQRRLLQSDMLSAVGQAEERGPSRKPTLYSLTPDAKMAMDEDDSDGSIYADAVTQDDADFDSMLCCSAPMPCSENNMEEDKMETSSSEKLKDSIKKRLNIFKF